MAKTTSPKYLDDAFAEICAEMLEIFIKKHKDYGKGNILDNGELGIVFRINDKLRRLQNLRESGKTPTNEAIEDTWIDISVYAVIALLLKSGKFKKLNLNPKV
ncbi:MAG: hypothetical protein A2383_01470 [Candidatus Pacebacteria bacterium RIFOXYB1_FULL_39_46]|nr:MAG: hypothetical protein A2383_01470 [Candidatus Pacebacteria bacterium RIFOXYB1_FULL_39_46]OGJ39060.1 MAG: hypothetical protein A2182_01890 [Candidatus Pacebacteria bacterium RIFOXYA1_FULL_38_18]OGJ40031.1 MAG: hypothetical protein A2582_01415 [Candidatus Pacebacteria bacterium RIFOXYD1_FULL_39_27]OGJ40707.1 MAG: hypothetical protein A2411_00280 [Candidatus Pacebacteria bacterium RIFOXYC1_FULL_39_21]